MNYSKVFLILAMMLILSVSVIAQNNLTDPYVILEKYYDAIGGLDNVKAEKSFYSEADIAIHGLEGTVKAWHQEPIYERTEVDLKIFRQTEGDNGEYHWTADANDKVTINRDEYTMDQRKIRTMYNEYEFMNPESEKMKVSFEGIEKVGENDCYAVKITNNINAEYVTYYINCSNFLLEKEIEYNLNDETHTLFSDYREVDGLVKPFHQEIKQLPINDLVTLTVTKYESNPEIDPAVFEPPGEGPKDFRFVNGDRAEDVPFEYYFDHVFLPVNMGGKERFWIFDTGAEITVIDSSFAAELGVAMSGDAKGTGTGNVVSFRFLEAPPFSVKGIEFDSQTIAALDIKGAIGHLIDVDFAGVLGYDFLSRFVIKIDYANKLLSFYDPKTFSYEGDGVLIDATQSGNDLTVPMTVDGKYSGRWRVDIGAGGCQFHYPFARNNGLLDREGVDGIGFGAGGGNEERAVQFESAELAGFMIDKPIIDIPREEIVGAFNDAIHIGNLGNNILRHFTIYIDYAKQQMIFEKGDNFDKKFPRSKSGLQIAYNDDKQFEVIYVSNNTPADKSGFKIGDVLLAINDIPMEELNGMLAFRDLMMADEGTKYKFTILRDGREKKIELKLRDLFQ